MKKLLLHICCAPCGTTAVERLSAYDITLFYFNPNIHPEGEWQKRLESVQKIRYIYGLPLIAPAYDTGEWYAQTAECREAPEGGARCLRCFEYRLSETCRTMDHTFDSFATTLTVSPHKDAEKINRIGASLAHKTGKNFLEKDFKKEDGFRQSVTMSREYNLYRQKYCGCEYANQ